MPKQPAYASSSPCRSPPTGVETPARNSRSGSQSGAPGAMLNRRTPPPERAGTSTAAPSSIRATFVTRSSRDGAGPPHSPTGSASRLHRSATMTVGAPVGARHRQLVGDASEIVREAAPVTAACPVVELDLDLAVGRAHSAAATKSRGPPARGGPGRGGRARRVRKHGRVEPDSGAVMAVSSSILALAPCLWPVAGPSSGQVPRVTPDEWSSQP